MSSLKSLATIDSLPAPALRRRPGSPKRVLSLFGTRPEVIKLAPVIQELERRSEAVCTINVSSGQHSRLLDPFIEMFQIRVDRDLRLMTDDQNPGSLCARITREFEAVVEHEDPDLILVQGDTTTALAGALSGHRCGIPVGHVEAGLRSGNVMSPYPEELHRRMITRLASYHFAATAANRDLLLSEGVEQQNIFLTGNPVVDALQLALRSARRDGWHRLQQKIAGRKYLVVTTHRRESFGAALAQNLRALCRFVDEHDELVLVFPVHPNPNVRGPANEICVGRPRMVLTEPLHYADFIALLSGSWLVVSDSGGVQEEAPSLGKPLLIIRENTERAECIDAGIARLVGGKPESLTAELEEAYRPGSWVNSVSRVPNPFGRGDSGERIVESLIDALRNAPRQAQQLLFAS